MADTIAAKFAESQMTEITDALSSGKYVSVGKILHEAPAWDVALILESTTTKTRDELWQLLDADYHGDVLEELSEEVRNGIITKMMPDNVVDALEDMDTDDLAETLSSLPDQVLQDILTSMDDQDRVRAEKALAYGEETAGFIMNTDTITLRPDVAVDVILRYLRLKGDLPQNTDTFYVVNRSDYLIGSVPVTRLLTSSPDVTVAEVMDEEPDAIRSANRCLVERYCY